MDKQTIAIIGAGFGGIRAAQDLARALRKKRLQGRYEVVLIDRNPTHVYTPLLYKFAALPPGNEKEATVLAWPVADLIEGLSVRFIEDEVHSFDITEGSITLAKSGALHASHIILAPGSETNYFGIPGLAEHALPLKTVEDAERIRTEVAALKEKEDATLLVGGAGPTGLEFAAETKKYYPDLRVILVEAAPTPLPGFDPRLVQAAGKRLQALGARMLLNAPVAKAEDGKATTKEGTVIPFDLFVWTGGVKPPAWLASLGLKTEPRGKVEADESLACIPQTADLSLGTKVYAIGDAVCMLDPATGKPYPGVAHTAMTQGALAAKNILADIEGRARSSYRHRTMPYVLPLGGRWAIAKIGPFILKHFPAWLFKEAIELYYLLTIMPLGKALRTWRKGVKL